MTHDADTFETLHSGLTVELIQTPRADLVTCRPGEKATDVLDRNEAGNGARRETYDYLPVEDGDEIVGLFRTRLTAAIRPVGGAIVESHMDRLSSANLIGGDGAILDFLREIDEKPYRLVVAGDRISGLVTWSDLQKLPVRPVLFDLVTGLEAEMVHAIKHRYPSGEGWLVYLRSEGRRNVRRRIERGEENDSRVDALLYTYFCDKARILRAMDCPRSWEGSEYPDEFGRIRDLRNQIAHLHDYVASRQEVTRLQETVRSLLRIRPELRKWRTEGEH